MFIIIVDLQGGLRGLFRGARIDIVKVVTVMFAIVNKVPFTLLDLLGIAVNKNTWTLYVKVFHLFQNIVHNEGCLYVNVYKPTIHKITLGSLGD